jgi:hypothetical protein
MRSRCSLALAKLRRGALPFSPDRDLVGQPEQTLRTSDGHPSGAEFAESRVYHRYPVDRPTPAAEAAPSAPVPAS